MIRKAGIQDIPVMQDLLSQVLEVHHQARPDQFKTGARKYTAQELEAILADKNRPIWVYEDENGTVRGYAFCMIIQHLDDHILTDIRTLYIDDLCVDQNWRHHGTGRQLYEAVCAWARDNGFYNVTLNVWADNAGALAFYNSLDLHPQKIGMEKIL